MAEFPGFPETKPAFPEFCSTHNRQHCLEVSCLLEKHRDIMYMTAGSVHSNAILSGEGTSSTSRTERNGGSVPDPV